MKRYRRYLMPCTVSGRRMRAAEVGGKAHGLFRLYQAGFRVPPWFVLARHAFRVVANGTQSRIDACIGTIDYTRRESIRNAAKQIADLIRRMDIPDNLTRDLNALRSRVIDNGMNVSVRSSAIGEDSSAHSFAGQLGSYLNIPTEGLPDAIRSVWASTFSERALVYRQREGLPASVPPASVIVQQMVDARVSGVLFTHNPEDGRRECVISAGYGWGEGIVQDLVETDTYRIGWQADDITSDIATKKRQVVGDSQGTLTADVPRDKQQLPALTDAQVRQLRDLGLRVYRFFDSPQDIEWAIDHDGVIYLLQARPIVFTRSRTRTACLRVWDNANIVESYPGLTLPLTFSFIRQCYETTLLNAACGFMLHKEEMRRHRPVFANMIGLLRGRVYYNLINWYTMLSFLPGGGSHKNAWDQMIGIKQRMAAWRTRLSFVNRVVCFLNLVYRLIAIRRTSRDFFRRFHKVFGKYRDVAIGSRSANGLVDLYEAMAYDFGSSWHLTLYNDFCAMKYYNWLKRLCRRWVGGNHPNLHNDLLCGREDIESVAPVDSLARLTAMFQETPEGIKLLQQPDDDAVWDQITRDRRHARLKQALDAHIASYGDRGFQELKLDSLTLREKPSRLIRQIKEWAHQGLTSNDVRQRERGIRDHAAAVLKRSVRHPIKRALLHFVLRNARQAISNRENMRFARTRVYGLVRRIVQRLGDILVQEGQIELRDDIHYLTLDEVFGAIRGTSVTHDAKALVAIRKSEYAQYATESLPARLETTNLPGTYQPPQQLAREACALQVRGIGCSSGVVEGRAVIVTDPNTAEVPDDAVLIADSTDPGWIFLMTRCRGIVAERGSILSHTAIIGRELGIPTVVGAEGAQALIPHGAHVRMDGSTGVVSWN
jgi:phosphohistidine swiveling domain-containing protein